MEHCLRASSIEHFFDLILIITLPCEWTNSRAGSQLKKKWAEKYVERDYKTKRLTEVFALLMEFQKKKKEEAEYMVAETRSDGGKAFGGTTTLVTGGFLRKGKDEKEEERSGRLWLP